MLNITWKIFSNCHPCSIHFHTHLYPCILLANIQKLFSECVKKEKCMYACVFTNENGIRRREVKKRRKGTKDAFSLCISTSNSLKWLGNSIEMSQGSRYPSTVHSNQLLFFHSLFSLSLFRILAALGAPRTSHCFRRTIEILLPANNCALRL